MSNLTSHTHQFNFDAAHSNEKKKKTRKKKASWSQYNFDRVSNNKQADPAVYCVQNGMAFISYVCVKLSVNLICMNSLLSMKILKYAKEENSFVILYEISSVFDFPPSIYRLFQNKRERKKKRHVFGCFGTNFELI